MSSARRVVWTAALIGLQCVLMLAQLAQSQAWYDSGWSYCRPITIDHAQVSAELSCFPLLIDISGDDAAAHAQGDGVVHLEWETAGTPESA